LKVLRNACPIPPCPGFWEYLLRMMVSGSEQCGDQRQACRCIVRKRRGQGLNGCLPGRNAVDAAGHDIGQQIQDQHGERQDRRERKLLIQDRSRRLHDSGENCGRNREVHDQGVELPDLLVVEIPGPPAKVAEPDTKEDGK
jgi:hypothetical protein